MAQHENCKKYAYCDWRKSVGYCPEECNHFKHKDEVIVVRCKDCEQWKQETQEWFPRDYYGSCRGFQIDTTADFYCYYGRKRKQ